MPFILALFAFVLLVLGGYGYISQPVQEPPWSDVVSGFAFSPYRQGQSPLQGVHPSREDISRDLALLEGKTRSIRTYTVAGVMGEVPELAAQHHINVALGAWLSADPAANSDELKKLLAVAKAQPQTVVRLIAGNETLLREELSIEQLSAYLDEVRVKSPLPVSTAEPWHVWLKHPQLAAHVDYLAVHLLPFWEGVALEDSVNFSMNVHQRLQRAFPGKPIVITEVGWPSHGRSIREAEASRANQAKFLRRFIHRAEQEKLVFYVMEAFDQPWKADIEGSVGAYWGVFNVARTAKFETRNPIVAIPEWKLLAAASIVVAMLMTLLLLTDSAALKNRGRMFLMFNAFVASSLVVYVIYDFSLQYHTWGSAAVAVLLLFGVVGVFVIVLAESHEWAEATWFRHRSRLLSAPQTCAHGREDSNAFASELFVSIHVPAHEEPPALLIATLNALAKLDYRFYEVIVVDNNTTEEGTWRPVQQYCAQLGERFRFFHVADLTGYKAGALNYALERTDPRAEVVAVIDADYCVQPNWLKDLTPQFKQAEIGIVQAPQDYRDGTESTFKALCHAEYKGFFHLGMVTRNERNAIIQHGTMTLVRRGLLESVGGWGVSTVTEDTELGLRVFEQGHEAVYIDHSYGKGLVPDTFLDYKNQRYRWAYGAMQILREHAGELLGYKPSHLTAGQRYHFVSGWLPWMADGLNLVFSVVAMLWSALMLWSPVVNNAPPLLISVVPIMFFTFRVIKLFALYLGPVRSDVKTAVAATLAGLSLSYTIGRAALSGLLLGRRIPFIRTPKLSHRMPLLSALAAARDETFFVLILLGLLAGLYVELGLESKENFAWCLVLLTQSLPYFSALVVSVIAALPSRQKTENGMILP